MLRDNICEIIYDNLDMLSILKGISSVKTAVIEFGSFMLNWCPNIECRECPFMTYPDGKPKCLGETFVTRFNDSNGDVSKLLGNERFPDIIQEYKICEHMVK